MENTTPSKYHQLLMNSTKKYNQIPRETLDTDFVEPYMRAVAESQDSQRESLKEITTRS